MNEHFTDEPSRPAEGATRDEAVVEIEPSEPRKSVLTTEATNTKVARRFGFLDGDVVVPSDFDELARDEIETMFYGGGSIG